jgi:hypothetical protein
MSGKKDGSNMLWPCPAGAIFQALNLFILCYILLEKRKVLPPKENDAISLVLMEFGRQYLNMASPPLESCFWFPRMICLMIRPSAVYPPLAQILTIKTTDEIR